MVDKFTTNLTAKDLGSTLNMLRYIINNRIRNMVNTMMIVKVVAVNGEKIDVQNVIQELDNNGTPIENYIIPSVRYINWQYGVNKIICKPVVGDVGILLVSKQDTSGLIKDGASIAQTTGVFNIGDGIYIGGLEGMNGEASQFIEFGEDSIKVTGTGTITIEAPTVEVKATTAKVSATTANLEATGTATVKGGTVNVEATTALNLGGTGGQGVARIGDSVNLQTGKIVEGSTLVKSV